MSDIPPPPPPPGPPPPPPSSSLPPPPPTNLVAPAGYAGYSATPFSQASLKRVGGVARASMLLVIATAVMSIAEQLVRLTVTDDAEDLLAGTITKQEFRDRVLAYSVVPGITFAIQIGALVVTIIWMHRVASNHRALHRGNTWGPGWAI